MKEKLSVLWAYITSQEEIIHSVYDKILKIEPVDDDKLLKYSWPGNIRELRNMIEYNIILAHGLVLEIIMHKTEQERIHPPVPHEKTGPSPSRIVPFGEGGIKGGLEKFSIALLRSISRIKLLYCANRKNSLNFSVKYSNTYILFSE